MSCRKIAIHRMEAQKVQEALAVELPRYDRERFDKDSILEGIKRFVSDREKRLKRQADALKSLVPERPSRTLPSHREHKGHKDR